MEEEFFSDAETCPTIVDGEGQIVYWRECFILVYKAGNTLQPIAKYDICDGQGIVKKGIVVWFGGKNGKVKEET